MFDLSLFTQDDQIGAITTALGKNALLLEGFAATERLSEPFNIVCEVLAPVRADFDKWLGTQASIELSGEKYVARAFHGILTDASEVDRYGGAARYSLTLRPWFWLLSLGRNSRIFQKKSAREIIKQVFDAAGVSNTAYQFNLNERGAIVREYCVQYGESDFNFVSRLMEEEGIYYYFIHSATGHVMKLCDGPRCHTDFAPGPVTINANARGNNSDATLWHWSWHSSPALTKATLRDVHFKTSDNLHEVSKSDTKGNTNIATEIFEYPGGFSYMNDLGTMTGAPDTEQGSNFAMLRLQAGRAERLRYRGDGDVSALSVGCIITTNPVDSGDSSVKVLVTGVMHRLSGQTYEGSDTAKRSVVSMSLEGVPDTVTWRPERRAPKPTARGPQVAIVVGKSGKQIDIDEWGRVLVQFPWDRDGESNELSSCRVRVSSGWAGPSLGEYMNPRIGQEVLVSYIEGDMDRPVITGRVFDSKNVFTPPPSELAYNTDRSAISGWITQTVGGKSTGDYPDTVRPPTDEPGYNALFFDDTAGAEYVRIRAQRDMGIGVYRNRVQTIHSNESLYVGHNLTVKVHTGDEVHKVTTGKRTTSIKDDETLTVETGNRATTVKVGNETHEVQTGTRTTTIKSHEKLTVTSGDMTTTVSSGNMTTTVGEGDETHEVSKGKRTTTVMGNDALTVKTGDYSVDVSVGSVSISALKQIQLVCGESKITMTPASIEIDGTLVSIKGSPLVTIN